MGHSRLEWVRNPMTSVLRGEKAAQRGPGRVNPGADWSGVSSNRGTPRLAGCDQEPGKRLE